MFKQTPTVRVLFWRRFIPVLLAVVGVFSLVLINLQAPKLAYATPSDTINFQARLQTAAGAIATDGNYNVEFKLYNASTGGTALWTEDYLNSNGQGLTTINGYLTANLGSITAFPSNLDWSQQMYLTMNIGGTGSSVQPTSASTSGWDGEMNPRLALTASPYALQAKTAAQASELSTTSGSNTATLTFQAPSANENFEIQDQGSAGTFYLLTTAQAANNYVELQSGTPTQQTGQIDISGAVTAGSVLTSTVDTASAGTISIGGTNATAISLGNTTNNIATTINGTAIVKPTTGHDTTTAFQVQGSSSSTPILDVDSTHGRVGVNTNAPGYALDVNGVINSNTSVDVNGVAVCTTACIPSSGSNNYIQNGTTVQTGANIFVRSSATGAPTGIFQGVNGQTADLLDLQTWNGTSATTVDAFGANGNLTISNGSTAAFQIQNAGSGTLLNADTTNMRLGVDVTYANLTVPTSLTATNASTGTGTLAASTAYYYEVTALDSAGGQTTVSNQATATTNSHKIINLAWTAVTGASAYDIYRCTGGSGCTEDYLTTVLTNSYADTGTLTPGTVIPPTTNSAYISTNVSNSDLQLSIGGNGTPTGQVYVSGTLQSSATGSIATGASPYDLAVEGNYAYVLAGSGSNVLDVYNIANPEDPILMSTFSLTAYDAESIVVQGKYAYINDNGHNKLEIVNISNPSVPVEVSHVALAYNPDVVYVQGKYAYVGMTNGTVTALQILDVSNPANPVSVSLTTLTGINPGGIYAQGNYLYIMTQNSGIEVFNVANPFSPTYVSSSPTIGIGYASQFYVQGSYAYATGATQNDLQIFNISNPANITTANTNGWSTGAGTDPSGIYVQGRYAYVTMNGTNKLAVYDVSNPDNPILTNTVATGTAPLGLAVTGRYAYVVNQTSATMQAFDLGGEYAQQLEAGGITTGTLQTNGDSVFDGNVSISGGLSLQSSENVDGDLGVSGNTVLQGTLAVAGGIQGGATISGLTTPSAPTITPEGTTGSTSYSYEVAAVSASGTSVASPAGSTTTGNATLTTSNYNQVTWTAVAGAVSYNIYRTAGGSTQGLIGNTTSLLFQDSGLTGSTAAPTVDTSGQLTVNGFATFKNTTNSTSAFQIQNTSGNVLFGVDTSGSNVNIGSTGSTALASNVNIGTSTGAAQTVTVGSTKTTSSTTIQGGTGGLVLQTGAASGGSGSVTIQSGDASSGTSGNVIIDTGVAEVTSTPGSIESDNFESTTSGWSGWVNSSVALSATQHHGGSKSLAVTTGTGNTSWGVQSPGQTTVPGRAYNFSAWVYLPTADTLSMGINWGSFPTVETIAVPANTWTLIGGTMVAPAGATSEQVMIGNNAQVANSTLIAYIDDVSITGSATLPLVAVGASNAAGVAIGNSNEAGATTIQGGTGGVKLAASAGGAITIGTTTDVNTVTVQSSGISETITGSATAPSDVIKTSTNSTSAFQIQNASNAAVLAVDTSNSKVTVSGTLTATGALVTQAGATFTTAGASTNAALNGASAYLLNTSGAAQVIQGITAGANGQNLTLTNSNASNNVTLSNNSASATGAKIITGTGSDYILAPGASISLIYDSANSFWRVVGTTAATAVTTVGAISGTSNANGATITGNTINLTAADQTNGGVVTNTTQQFAGAKTFNALLTGGAGLTVSGGAISLNASSNFAVNIGTGTSNAGVTIGNSANTVAISTSSWNVSSAGAFTGLTGLVSTGTIQGGNVTVGTSAGNGSFTDNGTTLYATDSSQSFSVSGSIANINAYSSITLTATAANLTLTLPDPSPTTAGKLLYISNNSSGSNLFTLSPTHGTSMLLNTGAAATLLWNGSAWVAAGSDASSILNQNSATQTANFKISGTGTANALQTNSLDVASAGALTVGGTTATSVTVGNSSSTTTIQGGTSGTGAVVLSAGNGGLIAVGDTATTTTINIGGVTNNGTDTVNIATNATAADTVTIGSTNSGTTTKLQAGTVNETLTNTGVIINQNSSSTSAPIMSLVQNGSSSSTLALQNSATTSAFYLSDNASNSNAFTINSYTAATTPTEIQATSVAASAAGTSQTLAFSSNNTLGNTIIVATSWNTTTALTPVCSDSQGNIYSVIVTKTDATNDSQSGICYASSIKAGANTVTVTFGASVPFRTLAIQEYSGIINASPVDTSVANTTTGTTSANAYTSSTATTATNGDLIFGFFADETGSAATATAGTGFTQRTNNTTLTSPVTTEDLVQSTAGSIAATQTETAAHEYVGMMMAFKPGSATGGSPTNTNANALFAMSQSGQTTLRNSTNSTTAFQVQNSSGASILGVDTVNSAVVLGADGTTSNITVRGGAATGSNVTGSNITFQASNGTGAAGSGSLIFQTAAPSSSSNIGVDNHGATYTFTTTQTLSFTTGAQSNRLMLVTASMQGSNTVNNIKYNGVNLTKITSVTSPNVHGSGDVHVEMWYLLAPPTGTFNLVATLNSADGGLGVTTYYNVNQTTPFGTAATNSGTSSGAGSTSVSTTTTSASQLVADGVAVDDGSPYLGAPGAGQTQQWLIQDTSGIFSSASSDAAGTGGTVTTTWGLANTVDWAGIGVPINPVGNSIADTLSNSFVLANTGAATFENGVNTTSAFQVQNSTGTTLLNADTVNNAVTVSGDLTASSTAIQSAGSMFNVSNTATLSTSNTSVSSGIANISRSLTANITGGSTGTPTLDHATSVNATASGNYSTSFTVNTGHTNNYLLVSISDDVYGSSSSTLGSPGTPTLTYGGVTLTEIGSGPFSLAGTNGAYNTYWYGLANPATGANTLSVTGNSASYWNAAVSSWYNVNQSTPYSTPTFNSGTAAATTTTSTAWTNGYVVVDGALIYEGSSCLGTHPAPKSGQTQASYNCTTMDPGGDKGSMDMSYKPATGSAITLGWSNSGGEWSDNAVALVGASANTETVSGAVATFSNSCTITAGSCSDATNVMQLQQQYSGATGAVLGIQNAGTGDMIDMTANGNLVASISSGGNLAVAGTISGGESDAQFNDTTTTSHTVSAAAFAYSLSATSGTTNTTFTSTINLTGLPAVNGTVVVFTVSSIKGASSGSVAHTVVTQINGTTIDTVTTATQAGASTITHSFIMARIGGVWSLVGVPPTSALSATTNTVNAADYAEYIDYSGDTVPQPGDVLTVGDDATSVKDSTTPYDSHLIGVVSTSPYAVGSADDGHSVILALTGRAPVKVSLENGPIEPGDPLTSSSTPGVAMKATEGGQIIGTALEAYDGTQSSNEINVQLNVGYDNPNPGTIQGDANISGGLYVAGNADVEGNLTVAGTTTTQNLSVTGTADLTTLTVSGGIDASSVTVSGQVSAATLTVSGGASFGGDITVSGHFITGGTAPTTAVNTTNAGNTSICTVAGNDTSGTITLQSQGTGQAAGAECALTFSKAFGSAPRAMISPNDNISAPMEAYLQVTPSTMTLNFTNAPAANTTYNFNYFAPQ